MSNVDVFTTLGAMQEQRLPPWALSSSLQLPTGLQQLMMRTSSSSSSTDSGSHPLLLCLLPEGSAAADVATARHMLQLADACVAQAPAEAAAATAAGGGRASTVDPPRNPVADKLNVQVSGL